MPPEPVKPDRTLIAIVAVIVAIVLIAVVVVFARGGPTQVDPTTPEGVVQAYSRAVIDGDRTSALALLTPEISANCDRADPYMLEYFRMTVVSTKIRSDSAVVRVTISRIGGDGLAGGGYDSEGTFSLTKTDDGWRIESTPWELMLCYNQVGEE